MWTKKKCIYFFAKFSQLIKGAHYSSLLNIYIWRHILRQLPIFNPIYVLFNFNININIDIKNLGKLNWCPIIIYRNEYKNNKSNNHERRRKRKVIKIPNAKFLQYIITQDYEFWQLYPFKETHTLLGEDKTKTCKNK